VVALQLEIHSLQSEVSSAVSRLEVKDRECSGLQREVRDLGGRLQETEGKSREHEVTTDTTLNREKSVRECEWGKNERLCVMLPLSYVVLRLYFMNHTTLQ